MITAGLINLSFVFAAAGDKCTPGGGGFFFFPPWWEYLGGKIDNIGQCAPIFVPPGDFFAVGLAILDMLLRVAGFIAVVSIIVAGIEYMTASGNPEKITNARKRVVNSLVGLGIALIATATVSFVGRQFG